MVLGASAPSRKWLLVQGPVKISDGNSATFTAQRNQELRSR